GIINQLTSTHDRIRKEVAAFFDGVKKFAEDEGENVKEAVTLYETVDRELAATLDQTLFDQSTQYEVNIQRVCFERSTRWPLVIRALAGGVECGSSGGRG